MYPQWSTLPAPGSSAPLNYIPPSRPSPPRTTMAVHRVQFADEISYHEYSPQSSTTPSPSCSASSLAEDAPHQPSTYHDSHIVSSPSTSLSPKSPIPACRAFLSPMKEDVWVHPSLATDSVGEALHLFWIVHDNWSTARNRNESPSHSASGSSLSKVFLAQAVTEPSSHSLTIRIEAGSRQYPWRINVVPQTCSTFITVEDVLRAINDNLRRPVKDIEFMHPDMRQELREIVSQARRTRLRCTGSTEGATLRVDYLVDKVVFDGLRVARTGGINPLGELVDVELEMRVSRQ